MEKHNKSYKPPNIITVNDPVFFISASNPHIVDPDPMILCDDWKCIDIPFRNIQPLPTPKENEILYILKDTERYTLVNVDELKETPSKIIKVKKFSKEFSVQKHLHKKRRLYEKVISYIFSFSCSIYLDSSFPCRCRRHKDPIGPQGKEGG